MTDPMLIAKKLARIESCVSDLLHRDGWIDRDLMVNLRNMAGFRNVLVHGYDDVDLAVVRDVLDVHVTDLSAFVGAVRHRLGSTGPT